MARGDRGSGPRQSIDGPRVVEALGAEGRRGEGKRLSRRTGVKAGG